MLMRRTRKSQEEVRTDEALEDLRCGTEERDRAVRGGEVRGLTRFGDRDDKGLFPDRGNITGIKGEVEEGGEEEKTFGT